MKRWNPVNVNTPAYFDEMWPQWSGASFDTLRMRAMTDAVPHNADAVDLGAGYLGCGMYLALNPEFSGRITAVDFCRTGLDMTRAQCEERMSYVIADVCCTPFPSAAFDVGFMGEIIEHVESPVTLLRELRRILKPSGVGVISTVDMHCATARRNGCRYPDHVWDFTMDSLRAALLSVFLHADVTRVGNYYIGRVRNSSESVV